VHGSRPTNPLVDALQGAGLSADPLNVLAIIVRSAVLPLLVAEIDCDLDD